MSTDVAIALSAALTVTLFLTIAAASQRPGNAPQLVCNWCRQPGERHLHVDYPDSPMPSYWLLCDTCLMAARRLAEAHQ